MRLALTGEPISAERASELGLVTDLAEQGGALDGAVRLARTIAGFATGPVQAAKRIIGESGSWPVAERWDRQEAIAGPLMRSQEARQGAAAFSARSAQASGQPADFGSGLRQAGHGFFHLFPLTPTAFLERSVAAFGQRIAVVDGTIRLTYEQFGARCARLVSALAAAGDTHVCLRKISTARIWQLLREESVTHFSAAPPYSR